MFENAIKRKYRFPTTVGMISVEDLWDLSIDRLDTTYKRLKSELKEVEGDSLLIKTDVANDIVKEKIEIVTYIFNKKVSEKEERLQQKEKSEKKQFLLSILKQKQNAEYEGKSIEDLQKLINEL